jgi:hypothetical protein
LLFNSQVTCFFLFIPSFFFFFFLSYLSSSFSFVRLSMSLTPLFSSVFLAFFFSIFRSFTSAVLCPVSRFFLSLSLLFSFFQPVFSLFPFCLALFLAVFLSAVLPFLSLVVFIPVRYSADSRWAVESHLSQKLYLLGKFYETRRCYVKRQLGICEEIPFLYFVFHFKLLVKVLRFISGSYTFLLYFF